MDESGSADLNALDWKTDLLCADRYLPLSFLPKNVKARNPGKLLICSDQLRFMVQCGGRD